MKCITNAFICVTGENSINPVFGDITISEGKIVSIEPKEFHPEALSRDIPFSDGDIYNAAGRVVTIPLVNFHDHIYSRLAKGQPSLGGSANFEEILQNLWWKLDWFLDLPMVEASAQLTALEAIRNGVTYIIDHHSSQQYAEGSLAVIKDALQSFNLRSVLCFETSDRNGKDITKAGLKENMAYAAEHQNDDHKALMGLHAAFTLDDDTLAEAAAILKENSLGTHIHLYEDHADRRVCTEKYGAAPVARLLKNGLLNEKSIIAHGLFVSKAELKQLKKVSPALAFNLDSNMNNGVGLPAFLQVAEALPLLAGTDGMHDNLARSMKQIFLAARLGKLDFGQAFGLFIKIYFDQIRFIRRYFPDYTDLNAGSRADLIIWDYVPPTPLLADNFWGHYIYGILESPVCTVMQAGEYLMKNYELTGEYDEKNIRRNIYVQGERLRACFEKELEKK